MPTVPGLPSAPPPPGGCWRLNSHLDSTGWIFLKTQVFNTDPMMEPPWWLPSLSSPGRWGGGCPRRGRVLGTRWEHVLGPLHPRSPVLLR